MLRIRMTTLAGSGVGTFVLFCFCSALAGLWGRGGDIRFFFFFFFFFFFSN